MSNPTPLRISSPRNNQTFCTKESKNTAHLSRGRAESSARSDSEEQTMTDFITVTAMWLLNGTEPGEILFPMSNWSLVPDNFGLDTHVCASVCKGRGMCCGDSWRACAYFQPAHSMDQTADRIGDTGQSWAVGIRVGFRQKQCRNPHADWEGHTPWTNSTGFEMYHSDNYHCCSPFQYRTYICCWQRCTECLSSSEGTPCEHTPSPGSGGIAACLITA